MGNPALPDLPLSAAFAVRITPCAVLHRGPYIPFAEIIFGSRLADVQHTRTRYRGSGTERAPSACELEFF